MGNTFSTLQTNEEYEFMESEEPELDNTNMDPKDADDIDFIAGELILTANTAHLSEVIGNGNNENVRTVDLLNKISTSLQDEAAIAKYSRIIETNDKEKPEVDTIRQEVSRYYLDIARVLVAISLAIQPENEAETHSDDTDDVLSPNFSVARMSFCGSRINRFAKTSINGSDINEDTHDVAEMNTLDNRYGIPELYDLYFDTDYDPETGSFLGMSEETKTIFEQDLARFYKVFSGETSVPEHIKRFGDIPINVNSQEHDDKDSIEPSSPLFVCKFDANDEVDCDSLFTSVHGDETNDREEISVKSQLLTDFAEHLQKMIKSVIVKRRRLVDIVNRMFVFGTRLVDGEKMRRPRVRPYLSSDVVKSLTTETHQIITDMSVQCEIDNRIGNEIFIALHAIQTLESNKRQIQTLEFDLNQVVYA